MITKVVTRRQKFILLALLLPGLAAATAYFLPEYKIYSMLGLALLAGFGFGWAIGFDFRFPEQLILPLYPSLWGVLTTAAPLYDALHLWARQGRVAIAVLGILGLIAISVFVYYLMFVSLNILNVATVRAVPLKQAAQSALFMLGLFLAAVTHYIFYIQLTHWSIALFFTLQFLVYVALVWPLLWAVQVREEGWIPVGLTLGVSLIAGLLGIELALAVGFLRIAFWVRVLLLSGSLFLLVGFLQHVLDKRLTRRLVWEYLGLGTVMMGILMWLAV